MKVLHLRSILNQYQGLGLYTTRLRLDLCEIMYSLLH